MAAGLARSNYIKKLDQGCEATPAEGAYAKISKDMTADLRKSLLIFPLVLAKSSKAKLKRDAHHNGVLRNHVKLSCCFVGHELFSCLFMQNEIADLNSKLLSAKGGS